MLLGFELFLYCDTKLLEVKEEDIDWVPTDGVDYMDPDRMTTLLGGLPTRIEESL